MFSDKAPKHSTYSNGETCSTDEISTVMFSDIADEIQLKLNVKPLIPYWKQWNMTSWVMKIDCRDPTFSYLTFSHSIERG